MAEQAQELGVDVITGFAADDVIYEGNKVKGILTKDFGLDKDGKKTEQYEPGV